MQAIWRRERTMARTWAAVTACALSLAVMAKAATWQIDTVDPTEVGQSSSMKIDRDGNAHVCYVGGQGRVLKYAYWDHTNKRWFTMVLDDGPNACSLTLDSKQHPHICYADYGTAYGSKLRYAHWDGKEWKKEAIRLNSEVIASYSSIGLDANDNPTIAFYEYRGARGTNNHIRLRTVRWNGKYWEVTTIDGQEGSGKMNNMAVDSNGHLHLAYANVASGEMRYAFWNGESWSLETIEGRPQTQQYVGLTCGIAIDKADRPHVVYLNATTLQIKYAVRIDGHWTHQVVDAIGGATEDFDRSSIAFDEQGRVYLGYYDPGRGILKVAHKEGPNWMVEIVDGDGSGFTSSMQIDRGVLWISYAGLDSGTLKVAHRELNASDAALPPTSEAHAATARNPESVKK